MVLHLHDCDTSIYDACETNLTNLRFANQGAKRAKN